MRNQSLAEKLGNQDYLDHLSERRRRELMFCEKMLTQNELVSESSIQVGYRIARDRFLEDVLPTINPDLAERAKEEKIPIFNMLDILEEFSNV